MCNRHKTVAVLVHSCLTAICPVACACVVVVVGGGGRGDNTFNAIFKEQSLLQRLLILVVVLVCS